MIMHVGGREDDDEGEAVIAVDPVAEAPAGEPADDAGTDE